MKTEAAIKWAGGSASALAKRLGISEPALSKWGEAPPFLRQCQIYWLSRGKLEPHGKKDGDKHNQGRSNR